MKLSKRYANWKTAKRCLLLCVPHGGEETDVVAGPEPGADGYAVKHSPHILVACAGAYAAGLRRREAMSTAKTKSKNKSVILQHSRIKLDVERHAAFLDDAPLNLLAAEFAILTYFMNNPGIVFTRHRLILAIRDTIIR